MSTDVVQEKKEKSYQNIKMSNQKKSDVFPCEYCGEFIDSLLLTLHVLQTHKDKIHLPFQCTQEGCFQKFDTEKSRANHHRSEHSSWMTCQKCNIEFSNSQSFIAHDVRVHKGDKYYNCPFCSRIYLSTHGWERHMSINHKSIYAQGIRHYHEKKFAAYKNKPLHYKILPKALLDFFLAKDKQALHTAMQATLKQQEKEDQTKKQKLEANKTKANQRALKKQKKNFPSPKLNFKRPCPNLDLLLDNYALQQGLPNLNIPPPPIFSPKKQ
jgi:uncharacterized C2H2 Zn-finger protein